MELGKKPWDYFTRDPVVQVPAYLLFTIAGYTCQETESLLQMEGKGFPVSRMEPDCPIPCCPGPRCVCV